MFAYLMIGFNAVMPMLVYMLIGLLLAKTGLMKQSTFRDLNKALFAILLPINLFTNIYKSDFQQAFNGFALAYILIIALVVFFILAMLIPRIEIDKSRYGLMLQGSVRSNAILFGLPLGTALLGENNMGMVTIIIAIIVPFWSIMSVIGFSLYSDTKLSVKDMAKTVFTNPMVIATIIGVIAVLLHVQFPVFLDTSLTNVTRMVAPLALMVLGGTFSIDNIKASKGALIFTLTIKLIIFPLIALTLGALLGFRNDAIISILIAFAGPTEVSSYAQAVAAGADGKLANQIVVISTILSIITLVIWISLLKAFGLF